MVLHQTASIVFSQRIGERCYDWRFCGGSGRRDYTHSSRIWQQEVLETCSNMVCCICGANSRNGLMEGGDFQCTWRPCRYIVHSRHMPLSSNGTARADASDDNLSKNEKANALIMYEYIQLDNNSDYQQYAPYDIVAINESFYKLYDRKNRVFLLKDLTVLPMDIAFLQLHRLYV